jgi:anti-sigma factor RsiW
MNGNNERLFRDPIMEALLRQVVRDNLNRELDAIEQDAATEEIAFSPRHQRRMRSLFSRERRKVKYAPELSWARRIAAVFVIAFALGSGVMLTAPTVRAAVGETVVQWFDKFVKFMGGGQSGWDRDSEPRAMPPEFSETFRIQENDLIFIQYAAPSGQSLEFTGIPASGSIAADNEEVEYEQVVVNEIVYHTFSALGSDNTNSVIWDMDGYRFSLNSALSTDELLNIAKNVK